MKHVASYAKKICEKDVVGIVTFVPDWFTSHQSHNCLNITMVYQSFVSKETFNVKS